MKIAFKIPPASHDITGMHLLAEAGNEEISFFIFSRSPFVLYGFYVYSFSKNISAGEYAAAIKQIISSERDLAKFQHCKIFYNRNECVLVPGGLYADADKEKYCELMFGHDRDFFCFHETIRNNEITAVYRVPQEIFKAFGEAFPNNLFTHTNCCIAATAPDSLQCFIYHNNIRLILFKENKLQVIQYTEYSSPADVCWHLLNICERFQMNPETSQLSLSGMVDEHSNLYKEIYRYFLNISFGVLSPSAIISGKMNEQPRHFYSHLAALAQCV